MICEESPLPSHRAPFRPCSSFSALAQTLCCPSGPLRRSAPAFPGRCRRSSPRRVFSNLISRFFYFLSSTIAARKSVCTEPTQAWPSKLVRCPRLPSSLAVDGLAPACILLTFEHFELRRQPVDLDIIWDNLATSLLQSNRILSSPPSKQTTRPTQPCRACDGQQVHLQMPHCRSGTSTLLTTPASPAPSHLFLF